MIVRLWSVKLDGVLVYMGRDPNDEETLESVGIMTWNAVCSRQRRPPVTQYKPRLLSLKPMSGQMRANRRPVSIIIVLQTASTGSMLTSEEAEFGQ